MVSSSFGEVEDLVVSSTDGDEDGSREAVDQVGLDSRSRNSWAVRAGPTLARLLLMCRENGVLA